MSFQTETYGKWILAGEHAVLRGVPALVLPVKEFAMKFIYHESGKPFHLNLRGSTGEELNLVFWGVMERALQKVERDRAALMGELIVESSLPLGAGLGASAALCVGLARIFAHKGWIFETDIYEFSRQLEGLFHGESSGVDIAIALEGIGLRFMRGGERTPLIQNWSPRLYLSYSGKRGMTSECVKKVSELWAHSSSLGEKIDGQMREAVEAAEKALHVDEGEGFSLLANAIDLARDCFYQWGLCEGELDQHIRELSRAGAFAAKPTGSGDGGYVLSLWQDEPPEYLRKRMVPV